MENKFINHPTKILPFKGYSFKKATSNDPKAKAEAFFCGTERIRLYVIVGLLIIIASAIVFVVGKVLPAVIVLIFGLAFFVPPIVLKAIANKNSADIEGMNKYLGELRANIVKKMLAEKADEGYAVLGIGAGNYDKPFKASENYFNRGISSNQEVLVTIVSGSQVVKLATKLSLLTNDISEDTIEYYISDIVSLSVENDLVVIKMNNGDAIPLTRDEAYSTAVSELRAKIREIKQK